MSHLFKSNKILSLNVDNLQDKIDLEKSTKNSTSGSVLIKITNHDLDNRVNLIYDDKSTKINQSSNKRISDFFINNNFILNNPKWIKIRNIFCNTTFKKSDLLIIVGVIEISIGLSLIFISICAFILEEQFSYLILIIGFSILLLGILLLLIRLIISEPNMLPFICQNKKVKKKIIIRNSAFYTVASNALRLSIYVPLRFGTNSFRNNSFLNFNNSIGDNVNIGSPKTAINVLIFANKLLSKVKCSKIYSRVSSSKSSKS